MLRKIFIAIFISINLFSLSIVSANANGVSEVQAQQLRRLEEIAGRERVYQEVPTPGMKSPQYYISSDCKLKPERVHKRRSGNYGTVGAKPQTVCTSSTPTSIRHTSTLYIVELGGLRYKKMATVSGGNRNTKSYQTKNLEWSCRNKNNSKFQQHTIGVIVVNGRTLQTSAQTVKSVLDCGY